MNDLYAVLFSWAVNLSGYPAPATPPEVVMVPHSFMVEKACAGRECKVLGWFPPGEKVYLDDRLDPEKDIFATSIVVHEMVHYLQHRSNKFTGPHSCSNSLAMEREAYGVQREFLLRYGVYRPVGASMHAVGCELAAQDSR
jgi:Zn-dependent peptidase ImmA (M78 family)